MWKNIQVIDGADNCTYSIFSAAPEDFSKIFPEGRDVEFINDFISRVGDDAANIIANRLWSMPVEKKGVIGIHGTLFYELDLKREFYPTKKETEMVDFGYRGN